MIGLSLGIMELLSLGIMTNFVPRMMQVGYVSVAPRRHGFPRFGVIFLMLAIACIAACFGSVGCGIMDAKLGPKKAIQITMIIAIIAIVLNLIPTTATKFASPALPGHHAGRRGQLPGLPDQHHLGPL